VSEVNKVKLKSVDFFEQISQLKKENAELKASNDSIKDSYDKLAEIEAETEKENAELIDLLEEVMRDFIDTRSEFNEINQRLKKARKRR
tara:strand:- start:8434 stop:8700 length:267 start_codon:yes stop_codon:yes gene_type:complete